MDRIDRIIEDILSIARTPQPVLAPGSLAALIETEAGLWAPRLAGQQISCSLQLAPDLPPVQFDPDQLSRVLANLFANSLEATPAGGEISISLELKDSRQVIVFADNGAGMLTEDVAKIFEPFFTTKPRGTGLGLFIASRIVENHGGTITVWSQPGRGARFTITLPSAGGSL
jgi:signal transduction histidine kinase